MIKTFEGFDFFLSQVKPSLKDVTAFSFAYLLEQYQLIIEQAESHLIKAAREQKTDTDKSRFIAAIEQCQRLKGGMISNFGHNLMEAMKPLNGHLADAQPQLHFQGSVSSLASHAREDETFMLEASTKAYKYYESLTNEITNALISIIPTSKFNRFNNPYNPMIIGNAIFSSLKITSMHSSAKKEVFVLFEELLFKNLNGFYVAILQHLRDSGAHVKIPNVTNTQETHDDEIPLLAPVVSEIDTIDSDFNSLLNEGVIPPNYAHKHYTPLEHQYDDETKKRVVIIEKKGIDKLLENIQKGYDPASDGALPEYIKSHLDIEAKDNEINVISQHDENIINLISLIFDQVAESEDKRMADLFLRLKVPYTRLALNDGLFFHDTSHPARKLLDELLTLTYSSDEDETLFKQLQTCVMKILLRYNGELSLFTDLIKVVQGYHESNKAPFEASLEAIRQKLEHEEQKRFAYNIVRELVAKKISRVSRRLRFHMLIEKVMSEVLVNILLTHGNESKTWSLASKLLDVVIILTDKNDSPYFKSLSADLANIIGKLSQFLSGNGIETTRKKVFLDQLQEIQSLLAQGKKLSDLDDDELSHTFDVDMIIDDYDSELVSEIDTAMIGSEHKKFANAKNLELIPENKRPQKNSAVAFVKNLRLGQWMSFVVDNNRVPCTPNYYSKQKDSYAFCDRHNKKIFERTRAEIAQDILTGFACPLESTLSFDGNLARVIHQLSSK
jgi:hypothetical protein